MGWKLVNMKLSIKNIIVTIISLLVLFFVAFPFVFYLKIMPSLVQNPKIIEMVESAAEKNLGVDLEIEKPVLTTELSPVISFKLAKVSLTKGKNQLLVISNLDTSVSFEKVLEKRIILKKLGSDYFYADVNKLMALGGEPKKEQKKAELDWRVYWFDSILYLKKCQIVYDLDKTTHIKVFGKNLEITSTRNPKYVRFDIAADVVKDKQKGKSELVKFAITDNDSVYIKNKKLSMDKGILKINNSKVFINADIDKDNKFNLTVFSNKFDLKNVVELMNTNLVVPGGDEIMAFFKDVKGSFGFQISMNNNGMNGTVKLNPAAAKIVPVANLPVYIDKGFIDITNDLITLRDFAGWYGSSKSNKVTLKGTVKDYTKSVDTNVEINGLATNDLMQNYISKLAGCKLTLTGPCGAKMLVNSKYNKMDFSIMGKVAKGQDILVEGASLSPVGYDRAFKADMHLDGNLFDIKSINYYIAKEITKNSKGKIKPILTINGKMDISTLILKEMGFEIPNPLPSEFLNVLIGQKVFKKGKIAGQMQYLNYGKVPKLKGELSMQGVRIPSQRLSIKNGKFFTDRDLLHITANGRFKRSQYDFDGNIVNALVFPVVIKDINLKVDNIDVERMMQSMNQQNTQAVAGANQNNEQIKASDIVTEEANKAGEEDSEESYDSYTFNTGLLIVERCVLEVVKGNYKDIKFGNLKANLTLDKNGLLQIRSNRFDFAEGISSLKVVCDLMEHKYSIALGVKDINSDLIAATLLALPREITGKARGLMQLNTDDSLKLNGRIRFDIQDGTIQKVGLVEYALKFAALFRNPMAMISPSTIIDLVNVPEGNFNKINGDLHIKNNIVERMMIKSSAPQLSSFIIGRYNLENGDAMLRIYTKFSNKNKGFAGFLRNISLNSLANRVSIGSRNDSLYYSAELEQLPPIDADEKDCQVFLTKVDGDVQNFNFLSSLKKIK